VRAFLHGRYRNGSLDEVSNYRRRAGNERIMSAVFSGIITAMGRVRRFDATQPGARLLVDAADWSHRPDRGQSISISGVCLTHAPCEVDVEPSGTLAFDVIHETLSKTTLGGCKPGDMVNLEHALAASDLIDGHIVQGHVDGVGAVVERTGGLEGTGGDEVRLTIEPAPDLMAFIVPKGSIALDGVSLTVAAVKSRQFEVALIPETLGRTTLGRLGVGGRVNLETDIISRTVVHWLQSQRVETASSGLSRHALGEAGFVAGSEASDSGARPIFRPGLDRSDIMVRDGLDYRTRPSRGGNQWDQTVGQKK
jgi:riboflavin synthase